jgi:hypothetical protein
LIQSPAFILGPALSRLTARGEHRIFDLDGFQPENREHRQADLASLARETLYVASFWPVTRIWGQQRLDQSPVRMHRLQAKPLNEFSKD